MTIEPVHIRIGSGSTENLPRLRFERLPPMKAENFFLQSEGRTGDIPDLLCSLQPIGSLLFFPCGPFRLCHGTPDADAPVPCAPAQLQRLSSHSVPAPAIPDILFCSDSPDAFQRNKGENRRISPGESPSHIARRICPFSNSFAGSCSVIALMSSHASRSQIPSGSFFRRPA